MAYIKADTWILQQIAATGLPLVGGSISAYITGTTTPLAMYTDSAGAGSATSFTLNSLGMPQSAGGTAIDIYLDDSKIYKFIIRDSAGTQVGPTIDPVYPDGGTGTSSEFTSLESLRASSTDADYITVLAANEGGSTGRMELYNNGTTGTPTTNGNRFSALAAGTFFNAAGIGYSLTKGQTLTVCMFGADNTGVADSTAAFAACSGKAVYVPAGTYLSTNADFTAATFLYGDGELTVIKPYTVTGSSCFRVDSGSSTAFVDDISINKMKFLGTVAADGFHETTHFIRFSGVRRFAVRDCFFVGPRGDAIMLGSGAGGGTERHNHDVTISRCNFDGVNKDNRNAISFIDINRALVENCKFTRFTRSSMPGSIDFEPDESFGVIKNVTIRDCEFEDNGGYVGHVAFGVERILDFENVTIDNCVFSGAETAILVNASETTPTGRHKILVKNCRSTCTNFFYKRNGHLWGATFENNYWEGLRGIWFSHAAATIGDDRYVNISNNRGWASATGGYNVLLVENNNQVNFSGNNWNQAGQAHVKFGNYGDSQNIHFNGDKFYGTPTDGAIHHTAVTSYYPATNSNLNCYFETTHSFRAYKQDYCGSISKVFDETTLPNAFPRGISRAAIRTGTSLPDTSGDDRGLLITEVYGSGDATEVIQTYRPTGDAADFAKTSTRCAASATTWGAWYTTTGV